MVKPVFRRKSIGTKVSEEEYAQLEALAGGRALSEWVREMLLRELDGRRTEEIVLAEVLALRTILLNAFYKLAQGEKGGASYRCLLRKHYTQGLRNYTRSMGLPSIWLARCWIEAATGNVSQHLSYDPRANHEGAARLGL